MNYRIKPLRNGNADLQCRCLRIFWRTIVRNITPSAARARASELNQKTA